MRVLAVDPGYDRLGVAILEHGTNNQRERLLYSTCLETNQDDDLASRLLVLGQKLELLFLEHTPSHVALETLFFNKNVKTALGVAQARGMILFLAKKYHCEVSEYSPQAVKVAVTGYGNSDKRAVMEMVKRLLDTSLPARAHDDEYDAIAVGITCLAHAARSR